MSGRLQHFFRYQFPAVVWASFIFIISSIPASKLPTLTHFLNDKVLHGLVFFVLGLLVYRALEPLQPRPGLDWRRLILAISAVVIYGITDEVHQGFVPGRSVDLRDAIADSVGGILSAVAIYIRETRRRPS